MNSKQTFKNQDLFSFVFKDQEFQNNNQFKLALNSNFKEDTEKMLNEDKNHNLKVDVFADFQLNMDVGINMFYFCFIKVFSYQKRLNFLEYQFNACVPDRRISFLHRIEALASANYWYAFGENSYYNPDTEKEVMDWVVSKYKGQKTK